MCQQKILQKTLTFLSFSTSRVCRKQKIEFPVRAVHAPRGARAVEAGYGCGWTCPFPCGNLSKCPAEDQPGKEQDNY